MRKFLFSILLVFLLISLSFAVNEGAYQIFLGDLFTEVTAKGGAVYNTWVEGLKRENNLDVVDLKSQVVVYEVTENEDLALVLFELKIKVYCLTSGGAKITVECHRLAVAVTKKNPQTAEDLLEIRRGKEIKIFENGWNGKIDI